MSSSSSQGHYHAQEDTMDTLVDHSASASESHIQFAESPQFAKTSFPAEQVSLIDQRALPQRTYVPPHHQQRCLILCFDGTGDQFDADNSNIVQLVSALRKDDRTKQMVYYQAGIGTYTKFATPVVTKLSLIMDTAIAWNLDDHVMAGYEFLMQNYMANDRICFFGFSRGAYIARSLAGMIHKVGLLPADNHQQVPFAYKMYTRTDAIGWAQSNAFKKAFSNNVHIDFLGVWDTVDSVGFIPRRLPFTTSNTIVRTFRHALSIDEHRAKFRANLWNLPDDKEQELGLHSSPLATPMQSVFSFKLNGHGHAIPHPKMPRFASHFRSSPVPDEDVEQEKFETKFSKHHHQTRRTDVLEVWFAGCHCDVGGGSVPNDTRHSLARIPLRWMIRECFKAETGIMFDAQRLVELGLDPATLYPFVLPRPPALQMSNAQITSRAKQASWFRRVIVPRHRLLADEFPLSPAVPSGPRKAYPGMEEEEDLQDALSPMYDQLRLKPLWWILEVIPFTVRTQKRDDSWESHPRSNLGRARKIPHQQPQTDPKHPEHDEDHKPPVDVKVHRTVLTRRAARDEKGRLYRNRAHLHREPEWVE